MAELLDFTASRAVGAKRHANLKTALDEAGAVHDELSAAIMRAQLAALIGVDATDHIDDARRTLQALGRQLDFAEALARRAMKAA